MEVHDYIPKIFDGETEFVGSNKADGSKWNAIHRAIDNPGSEVVVRSWSSPGALFNMTWVLGIALGLIWIMRNGKTVFTQWQQNMYRRANRRRHGIPDDDDRPFNVAYAAAALARKEKERQKLRPHINDRDKNSANSLRFRQPISSEHIPSIQPPALISRDSDQINKFTLPGEYLPARQESQQRRFIQSNFQPTGETLLVGTKPQGKRDTDPILGNQDRAMGTLKRHASQGEVPQIQKRGYKRPVDEEDRWETSLDKRVRVGSSSFEGGDQEDVEMGPPSSDIEPAKGTKRDREELESTPDSGADETDGSPRPRRIRQRREPSEKKEIVNNVAAQGHKRRHSLEDSTASDDRERSDVHVPKHKRRHRAVIGHDTTESEAEDVKNYSEDPACAGRKIGEIWEVNGQSFKVGLDGRRLRQVLVKQRRTKFPMPRDSTHSDVQIDVEVYVEKWLDDEEYKAAKENFELAWQDSAPSTPVPGSIELRQSAGKRLLWDGPLKSPVVKGRKSMLPTSAQNPFDLAPSSASRRASSVHMLAGLPVENPQLKASRSFSKWEKQDLEAISLKKMRARIDKEKKEHEPAKLTDSIGGKAGLSLLNEKSTTTPTTGSGSESISIATPSTSASFAATKPTLSFTKDQESKPTPPSNTTFTFAKPTSDSQVTKPTTDSVPHSFNFPQTSQPSVASAPSTSAPTSQPSPFNFNVPAASSTLALSSKPEPPKSTFSFQAPKTTTESTTSKPFGSPTPPTGVSSSTPTATPSSLGGPPKTSFTFPPQQTSNGTAVQSGTSASASFNFAAPPTSGSEAPKFTFDNSLKPANGSLATPTVPTSSTSSTTTTAPTLGVGTAKAATPSFNFGSTQPRSTPFSFGKPSGDATPSVAAGAPTKPSGSQTSNSQFTGFGTSVAKPDQATGTTTPPFTFGSNMSSDAVKQTPTNAFASTTPNSEKPKTSTESRTSMFGSQAETAPTGNIFSASPSTGQNVPSGQTVSESSKYTFGQPSQPTSAFGQSTEPKSAFGQISDSKNVFGQPSQPKATFGQLSESKNIFGQPSEGKAAGAGTFGQTSPNIFGKPSQSTSTFGQPSTFGQASEPKSVFGQPSAFGQPSEPKSAFGQASDPKASFGQTSEAKNVFGQPSEPKNIFGQSSEPKNVFGQSSEPKNVFGQSSEPKTAFGQPSESKSVFGQSSEPKSVFGQTSAFGKPSTETPKSLSSSNSTIETTKSAFGSTDSKSIFGQAPSKDAFGQQTSDSSKSAFGQTSFPTSSSMASFGNPSTSGSGSTLGSSESGGGGFKFAFGGGTSTPSSFTGFGNTTSGDKSNAFSQPQPANNAGASSSTPVFGQPSTFGSSPASTSAFGLSNTQNPGAAGSTFGNSAFSFGQPPQPGASTSSFTTQTQTSTPPANNMFSFNKPSEEEKK